MAEKKTAKPEVEEQAAVADTGLTPPEYEAKALRDAVTPEAEPKVVGVWKSPRKLTDATPHREVTLTDTPTDVKRRAILEAAGWTQVPGSEPAKE